MSNEIAEVQNAEVSVIDRSPHRLIELAIDKNADIEKLEKLMAMQITWDEKEAKKSFTQAITEFQSKCPVIKKLKQGHNSKYAPISDIIAQIKDVLAGCNLAYRFEQNKNGQEIEIICVITHKDGHSERTAMIGPLDTSGSKNAIQASGSTVTYLQRYTLTGALGIATADEDMDGRVGNEVDYLPFLNCIRENFEEIYQIKESLANEDVGTAVCTWSDFSREDQMTLWVAPSKGGIFTTWERDCIKKKELVPKK